MAKSSIERSLFGALAITLAGTGACGSSGSDALFDDDRVRRDAGSDGSFGGTAGTAGSSGAAGASGMGGAGGSSGRGGGSGSTGSAGAGGSGAGGSAGSTGGSAGRGGTGGSAGSSATGGSAGSGASSSGASGSGAGGSGAGGSAGSAGTGGGTCPATLPAPGSSCSPDGLHCNYGTCCPSAATCSGGRWQVVIAPCVPPQCPSDPPRHGEACNPCQDGSGCRFDLCDDDDIVAIASCSAESLRWEVTSAPCKAPCGPGDETCAADEICVRRSTGAGFDYSCEDNPCDAREVTCRCAASLCDRPYVCGSASAEQVNCECPACS